MLRKVSSARLSPPSLWIRENVGFYFGYDPEAIERLREGCNDEPYEIRRTPQRYKKRRVPVGKVWGIKAADAAYETDIIPDEKSRGRTYWYYRGALYWEDDDLTQEEVKVLLDAREVKKQRKIDEARRIVEEQAGK